MTVDLLRFFLKLLSNACACKKQFSNLKCFRNKILHTLLAIISKMFVDMSIINSSVPLFCDAIDCEIKQSVSLVIRLNRKEPVKFQLQSSLKNRALENIDRIHIML